MLPAGGRPGGATLKGVSKKGSKKKHKQSEPDVAAGADAPAEQHAEQQLADDKSKRAPPACVPAVRACAVAGCHTQIAPPRCRRAAPAAPKADACAINVMSGKSYEQEFDLEQQRMAVSQETQRKPAVAHHGTAATAAAALQVRRQQLRALNARLPPLSMLALRRAEAGRQDDAVGQHIPRSTRDTARL